MFVCQMCGGVVPPRTRAAKVVVARRAKVYPRRPKADVVYTLSPKGGRKKDERDDPGGIGWEVAKEVQACPACAANGPG